MPDLVNQQLVAAISAEWKILENDDYIIVLEKVATGETPQFVGMRSTDPGVWFSSLALAPDLYFASDCDPYPDADASH